MNPLGHRHDARWSVAEVLGEVPLRIFPGCNVHRPSGDCEVTADKRKNRIDPLQLCDDPPRWVDLLSKI